MKTRFEHPDYDLLETCGQGGMGVVYRARDRRLNRVVALKFLASSEDDEESARALQRFQREAEAIAALNFPGIATIYQAGNWEGVPFLSLEYLGGGTLRARLPARFGLAEILNYAAQLGDALAYAHSKGVLHRDIKPANCMFNDTGVLKLVDFGLAKPIGSHDITQAGSTVGTIPYMAPELLRGDPATVRSDLYALGAVIYEMASGRPLYPRTGLGPLVQRILEGSAVPLAELRPDLPKALCAAVDRAVSTRPADRFVSVQAFVDAIRSPSILQPDADVTPTATMGHSSVDSGKRRSRRWLVVAGAALLTAAAAAIFVAAEGPQDDTLVVLPFENLGGNPADQALCVGLQETVTSLLSSARELPGSVTIVPSAEVRRAQIHTPAEARKQFRATLVLTGTAQQSSSELQVILNLVDARKLRQKMSRILRIPAGETADLQPQLKENLGAMFGSGPLRPRRTRGDTTANSTAYDLFLRGRGALEDRKRDDAVRFLKQAVEADPDFALARAKLAEAYLRLNLSTRDPKWLSMADDEIARAASEGAGPEILMSQALIRRAIGKWQEAIALFQSVVKNEPGNMEAYRFLAETWDSSGKPKEAEKTYREALRLWPGYWPLYDSLGNFYSTHHEYPSAEQTFTAGIALGPDSAQLYYDLGANYFRMSRWAEAAAAFEKSLAIRPTPIGYSNLGTVRFYQGNYAEAAKQCEMATRLQPANPINWGNLGDALWQLPGRRDQAKAAFEKAASVTAQQLAINPDNPTLRKLSSVYFAKLGDKDRALQELTRVCAQAPNDGSVAFYAARVFAVLGDAGGALGELERSVKLGYSSSEIEKEPDFADLRTDPRYRALFAAGDSH
ncbi:MAG TPA: protein kinase [Bryobacteraceae bacterium]|nr:protein kinase [Bryobacteraceae bacterium]